MPKIGKPSGILASAADAGRAAHAFRPVQLPPYLPHPTPPARHRAKLPPAVQDAWPLSGTARTMSLTVGAKIELNDGRLATVRFLGPTNFQTGEWVGVELDEATGKNDGAVKGGRYFQCQQGYGMFLRPSGVKRVVKAAAAPKATPANGGVNGLKRQSIAGASARRESTLPSSPTPGARGGLSGLRSPTKSPTKQIGSNGVSSASSRTSTPPAGKNTAGPTAARSRQSMLPPSTTTARRQSAVPPPTSSTSSRSSRPSLVPPSNRSALPSSRTAPGRAPPGATRTAGAVPPTTKQRLSSTTEETASEDGSEQPDILSPKASATSSKQNEGEANGEQAEEEVEQEEQDDTVKLNFAPPPPPPEPAPKSPNLSRSRRPSSPTAASIHSQRTIRSTAASNRQIEELEAKVRLLERKRLEDRDLKKTLDHAQQERDQYKGIIEKLQTKYRPQQQEIYDLKKALSEAESKFEDVEALQAEHDSAMEMATLDREMAEETAEGLKAELEALRAHNEEVELELELLREENSDLSKEMTPEERESAGFVQLQHSNERLRNALLALRDRALDEKEELNEQIGGLHEQVKDLETLRPQHEELKEKLLRAEADTNDLQQQLEAALQAEEMIEQLTERNGRLTDTVDDLKAAVEDLENLKEVNDELEQNHVDAEKQMQEEIDFQESLLLDRERTSKALQEALDDRDYTITQFRALVSQLQADMADMKASKQLSETEAKDLEGKSRAMLDLNLKLQNSAAKTQVKTIDLELRRLDAQEASEHLAIVQLFLPEAFHAERDSVQALLRFKRIGFKATLIHSFIKERISSFGARNTEQDVFAACDSLDKLTWISAMAGRFVNSISSCNPGEFSGYESAYYELEPVERALNSYVDGLRRDELKEKDMAEELQRSIAVMSHLSSLHIKDNLGSHADDLLMRTQCLQSQLESAATALQLIRTLVEKNVPAVDEDDEDDEGSASDLAIIINRAETLITQARSAKVTAGKTQRLLSDLQERHLTLENSHTETFESTEAIVSEIVGYTRQVGDALSITFSEEGRTDPFTAPEVASALSRVATSSFVLQAPELGPFNALASRVRDLNDILAELAALPAELDNTVEFERSPEPWVARAEEIRQTKLTSIDTEAELARTLETLRGRDVVIKEKETELEEQSVRIEMLEARMRDASKRSARIAELEKALHEAKDAERRAKRDVDAAKQEKDREVERARAEMGRLGEEKARSGAAQTLDEGAMGAGARVSMKKMEVKITNLEGAVRYLKDENMRLRLPAPDSPLSAQQTLSWLHDDPLTKPTSDRRRRELALQADSKSLLKEMLNFATLESEMVDLTKMPANKLAWRPARETPRWKVEKRKEGWEGWKGWKSELLRTNA